MYTYQVNINAFNKFLYLSGHHNRRLFKYKHKYTGMSRIIRSASGKLADIFLFFPDGTVLRSLFMPAVTFF